MTYHGPSIFLLGAQGAGSPREAPADRFRGVKAKCENTAVWGSVVQWKYNASYTYFLKCFGSYI